MPDGSASPRSPPQTSQRPKAGQHILRGPVPFDWLCAAAQLPGKSLHVGIALWYTAGLNGSREVALSNVLGRQFGLYRNSKYRGLDWLEEAGLITIERKLGRAPVVSIIAAPPDRQT